MRLVLIAVLFTLTGCLPDQAPLEPDPADAPILEDPDAVLDSLVARWEAASADLSGFTLATEKAVVQYALRPDGSFRIANAGVRAGADATQSDPPPIQFLLPDHRQIASLLRGRSDLAIDRSTTPARYRLIARPDYLAEVSPDSLSGPFAAPVAADAVVEAGTYHLREIRTRSPLPGSTVDSALVDLRIAYSNYEVTDGLPAPRAVTVIASGLSATFDAGELMFLRAQYQQRRSQIQGLTGEARAAEEAAVEDLRALIEDGVSTQTMRVDSVAVTQAEG
ncbi:MAG: hypothetical protein AAF089_18570 [Bacteroidota bacterium]